MSENPRIIDNDQGEIVVTFEGRTLRSWSYGQDTQRRVKMLAAREFVEGWCAGRNETLMTQPSSENPRVTDNGAGEIVVTLEGRRVRSWDYADDTARRSKMQEARNYVGDWIASREELLKRRA